jgi:pantothenate kinase
VVLDFECVLERAHSLAGDGGRRILGICGAPGSGKSMLATRLASALPGTAVVVGMDGFHLAQRELERLGTAEAKGAPETFDAAGYVALLRRLRGPDEGPVYAPEFRREIEEPVACAVPVAPGVPLVITEGNYLLLDRPPWDAVRGLLDEVWFLRPPEHEREARLVARHVSFGRTRAEAEGRAYGSDGRNAETIAATLPRADLVLRGWYGGSGPS